jgi:hypothetical protein
VLGLPLIFQIMTEVLISDQREQLLFPTVKQLSSWEMSVVTSDEKQRTEYICYDIVTT